MGTARDYVDPVVPDADQGRVVQEEVGHGSRGPQACAQAIPGLEGVAPFDLAQEEEAPAQVERLPGGPHVEAPGDGLGVDGAAYVEASPALGEEGLGMVDEEGAGESRGEDGRRGGEGFEICPEAVRVVPVAVGEDGRVQDAEVQALPGGVGQEGPGLAEVEQDLPAPGLEVGRESRLAEVVAPVDDIIVHEYPQAHGTSLSRPPILGRSRAPRNPGPGRPSPPPHDRAPGPGLYSAHMLHLALALGLSAAPALLLLLWVYRRDRARPEPLGLVWKSAFYGFLAVIPAAILELGLVDLLRPGRDLGGRLVQAFLIAGLVEEGVKLAFLRVYLFRRPEFDERMDGIVYAICVSLGFAFVENFIYGYRDTGLLILRGFTSVPLHAMATGIMGYWLGRAKIEGRRDGNPRQAKAWKRGLLWAVAVHGLYDFFLLTGAFAALLVIPLLALGWWALGRLAKKALALDNADPGISASQSRASSLP